MSALAADERQEFTNGCRRTAELLAIYREALEMSDITGELQKMLLLDWHHTMIGSTSGPSSEVMPALYQEMISLLRKLGDDDE